jgi:polyisoprenoid-binding protein YceI
LTIPPGFVSLAIVTSTAITDFIPDYVTGTWDIDVVHSDVSFVVRHVGLTKYRRSFERFSGEILTAEDPANSSVTATIDMTSFDTGLEAFNRHLLSAQFLDTETHPTATFRWTRVHPAEGGGSHWDGAAGQWTVDGELTLRGVTRPVALDLELLGFGEGMNGERKAAFSASTMIDRTDFGITFDARLGNGRLIVGNKVRVLLEIEAVLRAAA